MRSTTADATAIKASDVQESLGNDDFDATAAAISAMTHATMPELAWTPKGVQQLRLCTARRHMLTDKLDAQVSPANFTLGA